MSGFQRSTAAGSLGEHAEVMLRGRCCAWLTAGFQEQSDFSSTWELFMAGRVLLIPPFLWSGSEVGEAKNPSTGAAPTTDMKQLSL